MWRLPEEGIQKRRQQRTVQSIHRRQAGQRGKSNACGNERKKRVQIKRLSLLFTMVRSSIDYHQKA
jgi:hypothetical protein